MDCSRGRRAASSGLRPTPAPGPLSDAECADGERRAHSPRPQTGPCGTARGPHPTCSPPASGQAPGAASGKLKVGLGACAPSGHRSSCTWASEPHGPASLPALTVPKRSFRHEGPRGKAHEGVPLGLCPPESGRRTGSVAAPLAPFLHPVTD